MLASIARIIFSGTVASVITAAGLAALSKAEGRHPLAPINATSHWLFGDKNIKLDGFHPQQTLIGFATHHASAIFWALVYEYGTPRWVPKGYREATAAPTAIFAALLDYGLLPPRISPGWELAISKKSVGAGFVLLGAGLAIGRTMFDRRTKRSALGSRSKRFARAGELW